MPPKKTKVVNKIEYKIEKNIPIVRARKAFTRFPLDEMEVGDSFYIPLSDQKKESAMASIYSAANSFNRSHKAKIKVSTRSEADGLRVWRIK